MLWVAYKKYLEKNNMPKINNSDYHRWAKRKSTKFLNAFIDRFAPAHARAQLLQTQIGFKTPKYLERKLKAAINELARRNTPE